MRVPLLMALLCVICFNSNGQIISPDTVCVGTPVTFTTPDTSVSYAWAFDAVTLWQPLDTAEVVSSGPDFVVPACITMNYDAGNYYSFSTNHGNQLIRLDYGTNPLSTPTITDLGSLGGALTSFVTEDIDLAKDSATNTWYGFIADGGNLVRLNFGATLTSTPTTSIIALDTVNVHYGMQISVMKYHGQWIAFEGTYNTNYIVRLDFGSSLVNPPVATDLPNYGYLDGPCYFAIMQQSDSFYMIVSNLNNATLTRYNFGTNLQNNSPTATNLGNPGGLLSDPRGITFIQSCDSFYGLMTNEGSVFFKLDFAGDITNTPVLTNLGSLGTGYGIETISPFWYTDTLYLLTEGFTADEAYRIRSYWLPAGGTYSYTSSSTVHTFDAPGTYHVSLFCDQGSKTKRAGFCKDIVVVSSTSGSSVKDTSSCMSSISISSSVAGASSYAWSTGATTASVTASASGTYWVTATTACSIHVDTIHVTLSLGGTGTSSVIDTATCSSSLPVSSSIAGASSYLWNTGATTPSITASSAGTYWVTANTGPCTYHTDTIQVTFLTPVFNTSSTDTSTCKNSLIVASAITGSSSYIWNTGDTTSSINVTSSGTYWVKAAAGFCAYQVDTIHVRFDSSLIVNLGSDTSACGAITMLLDAENQGDAYLWSNGSTAQTQTVTATTPTAFWVTVTAPNGCSSTDSIFLNAVSKPYVSLPADTNLCMGDVIILAPYATIAGSSFIWSDGDTQSVRTITQAGTYEVNVRNACGIARGEVVIQFHYCQLWMPNAFTPNNDGLNDYLKLQGDLSLVSGFEIYIYNRWGQCVYRSNDKTEGWDGSFKGVIQPVGVFDYFMKFSFDNVPQVQKGNITLIK